MKEKVNELLSNTKEMSSEIAEMKNGISMVYSMLEMLKHGISEESVKAMPAMIDVVIKNLDELVDKRMQVLNELTVKNNRGLEDVLVGLNVDVEKPKRTRRSRVNKNKEENKAENKIENKVVKKAEQVNKKTDIVVNKENAENKIESNENKDIKK